MRASSLDYQRPNKANDRDIASWDGYSLYLLVGDDASRYIWVFLTKSKELPLDIIGTFLDHCGHEHGGLIHTDQGGELAHLFAFMDMLLRKHKYVIEPMGADSPLQNLKSTMPNWWFTLKHCYLVWVSLQSIGHQHWCILCISATD